MDIKSVLILNNLVFFFSRNKHFHQTKKHNVGQARKAMHVLLKRIRNLNIQIDLKLCLFDLVIYLLHYMVVRYCKLKGGVLFSI